MEPKGSPKPPRESSPPESEISPVGTSAGKPVAGLKLLPRDVLFADHPGHMGVTWKFYGKRVFRGFRFDVSDLPEEFRSPAKWRSYLFEHSVAGRVVNDINLQAAVQQHPEQVLCKQWGIRTYQWLDLLARCKPGPRGRYSFSPDKPPDCHNCVTWAIETIRGVLGEVLPPVPSGRIKLATKVLSELGAQPCG